MPRKKTAKKSGKSEKPRLNPTSAPDLSLREEILALKEENFALKHQVNEANARAETLETKLLTVGSNQYKDAALKVVRFARHKLWECKCKTKAYRNYCERYSCRHIHGFLKPLSDLLEGEGLVQSIQFDMPKKEAPRRGATENTDAEFPWENVGAAKSRPSLANQ